MRFRKDQWELIVLALCEYSNTPEKCSAETFHKLQTIIREIMLETGVEWPYNNLPDQED
jgi:hypothetical protein